MSGDQDHQSPSIQDTFRHNVFLISDSMCTIFQNLPSSVWNSRSGIGVFSLVEGYHDSSGISILSENQVKIAVSARSNSDGPRDLIEVKNALSHYLETLQDMIYSAEVNIIVSSLGDAFSAGVTPEIAQLSSRTGAVTIGVLTLPHPDEGNKYLQHSRFALEYTRSHLDAMIILPMESIYKVVAPSTMTQHIGEKISLMISRIARGVVDGMKSSGFHDIRRSDDIAAFFHGAGELLISYQEIDHVPNGPYHAIHRCLQEPFHALRRFEGAQKLFVSVCYGESGLPVEEYLRIGQFCRNELGHETDILVRPFSSSVRGETPFIVVFGRDIIERRSDGFDFPYAEVPPEKAPSRLPAYYRKYYGTKRRAISHDVSNF